MFDADVVVIGAGVVGLAIARTLALHGREVIVIERETLIGSGTSSRNSEVIHAGIYYEPGSLKAKLCVEGRDRLYAYAAERGAPVVAICAKIESEIADLDDEEKKLFLSDMGMQEPGLNRLIRAGFQLLGLQTYFTAGVKEVRAWTVRIGATAPQAAGVIHTDFEKGFIRAEVIAYDDYVACKGEQGAKEKGKMRLEGKDYIVKDGDVMHFRFNV